MQHIHYKGNKAERSVLGDQNFLSVLFLANVKASTLEDFWEFLGLQGAQTSQSWRKSVLNNTLTPWCEELTHLKRPWCWERLKVGGGGDDRGWDVWMTSPTGWTWVWVSSRSWWWAGMSGMLQSMGSQKVRHNWVTELNWIEYTFLITPTYPRWR